jgi:hypothetical protein
MDHRRAQADLAHELGVSRRTLTRWAHKRDRLIAEGVLDPPRAAPVSAGRSLKASDSGYGTYGANPAAGYRPPGPAWRCPAPGQLEAAGYLAGRNAYLAGRAARRARGQLEAAS